MTFVPPYLSSRELGFGLNLSLKLITWFFSDVGKTCTRTLVASNQSPGATHPLFSCHFSLHIVPNEALASPSERLVELRVIKCPRLAHHFRTLALPHSAHRRFPAMLILRLFSLVLANFWSATDEPYRASDEKTSCTTPAVRREWRKLSAHEKAEWIGAVNVRRLTQLISLG
jgi:hypothetical protein